MAQHGYLHDTYDRDDFGRGDDSRDRWRSEREDARGWRGRDEERGWRERDAQSPGQDRESMFGWRDQDPHSSDRYSASHRNDDRGFFERAGDEVSSWLGGDDDRRDRQQDRYGSRRDQWTDRSSQGASQSGRQSQGYQGDRSHVGSESGSNWKQGGQRYSAHPDDHYRSWRDKQMHALDRDYQDYCREREQQFHSDFDTWRQNRQAQGSTGSDQGSPRQSQESGSSAAPMELDQPAARGGEVEGATPSAMGAATMGTNNSENDASGTTTSSSRKR